MILDATVVGTACAVAALAGGLFLWVIKMVVENAINKASMGVATTIAVLVSRADKSDREIEGLRAARHTEADNKWLAIAEIMREILEITKASSGAR